MTPYEWASVGIAVLGLLGGGFGFFYGRAARRKANASEAIALKARTQSAEALERSAGAAERVAEVWEQLAKPPEARPVFEVGSSADRTVGWVQNVGDLEARALTVRGYPEQVRELVSHGASADLPPRQTFQFNIDERFTLPVKQVEIAWTDDRSDEVQRETFWL